MKILLIAPHVDDIEFAAGGSVARWIREGHDLFYILFSTAQESNPGFDMYKENQEALKILGIKEMYHEEIPVRYFPDYRQQILESLISLKEEQKPDLVVIPSISDWHQDHRTVGKECVRAFKDVNAIAYLHIWNCQDFRLNYYVKITESDLNLKIKALSAYKSQQKRKYFDVNIIKEIANIHGFLSQSKYAEGFDLLSWRE